MLRVIRQVPAMQAQARAWSGAARRIGLVPTMGCLHEGHAALIREARRLADRVVVSLFVNPTQFGPGEGFTSYPRDEAADLARCRDEGVAVVFAPDAASFYPGDASTWVEETVLSQGLCGRYRPGHFRGVTTVVAKLLHAVCPDVAVFGEKDYQQLCVIRRMIRDLNMPVRLVACATVREADGLAMSSRNRTLSVAARRRAARFPEALRYGAERVRDGRRDAAATLAAVRSRLEAAGLEVQYLELVHPDTLAEATEAIPGLVLAAAVICEHTRLIDNIRI